MVFFGAFTAAIFIYHNDMGPLLAHPMAPWIFLACYLAGVAFIYFTFWRLFRVDADDQFFYVTNYFKTYKYPFHQIVKVSEQEMGFFPLVTLHFPQRFSFGKKVHFIADKKKFQAFLEDNAEKLSHLMSG